MHVSRRDFLRCTAALGAVVAEGGLLNFSRAADGDSSPPSPFLQGNFAPVQEEVTVDKLEIIGRLPEGLTGMFVRNGPNPQFAPKGRYHWFDGDGMLHGVRIQDGQASYRNRYVRTAGWQEEHAAGKALYTGLAEPFDLNRVVQGGAPFKNAANTALVWHDGRLLALWEGGEPHEVRAAELTTVGPFNYDKGLKHPFTAHPKVDAATGEMMFFGYSALTNFVQYSVVNAAGQLQSTTGVKLRKPVMMHDFAVTERHSIFMDLPTVFDMAAREKSGDVLRYRPDLGARIGVLPRHAAGSEVRWFDVEPCFVFHTLNAFEEGDEVVLLACRMTDYPSIVAVGAAQQQQTQNPLNSVAATLHRWRLNLQTGGVREEMVDDTSCDFPRLAETLLGRPHRFGYAMDLDNGAQLKFDLTKGSVSIHSHGPQRFGGEGVFVPRPGASGEDDGWLLSYVYDGALERSELVVIESRDFSSEPIARVRIPARIPYGFHGLWLSEAHLAAQRPVA